MDRSVLTKSLDRFLQRGNIDLTGRHHSQELCVLLGLITKQLEVSLQKTTAQLLSSHQRKLKCCWLADISYLKISEENKTQADHFQWSHGVCLSASDTRLTGTDTKPLKVPSCASGSRNSPIFQPRAALCRRTEEQTTFYSCKSRPSCRRSNDSSRPEGFSIPGSCQAGPQNTFELLK